MRTKKVKARDLYKIIRKSYLIEKMDKDTGKKSADPVLTIENIQNHKNEIIELVKAATPEEKQKLIFALLCTNHTEKMAGMVSLSTCCKTNAFCKVRAKIPNSICEKCYAMQQLEKYANQFIKNAIAGAIFTSIPFKACEIPFLNVAFFRFEAFGDLENETQLKNYTLICKVNKHANCALWTKNSGIACRVFREQVKKPKNLICIYSPLYVNKPENEKFDGMRDVFDKQFTVYSNEDAAMAVGAVVNCGGASCAKCLNCYKKNNIVQVVEIVK